MPLTSKPKTLPTPNVAYSPRKLLALWEGGKPYALDPETLETIGEDDLGRGTGRQCQLCGASPL
jgi:carotenoid cleavage dioxygenase-like enzyme